MMQNQLFCPKAKRFSKVTKNKRYKINLRNLLTSFLIAVSVALSGVFFTATPASAEDHKKICEGKSNPTVFIKLDTNKSCSDYYFKIGDVEFEDIEGHSSNPAYDHFQERDRSADCYDAGKKAIGVEFDICAGHPEAQDGCIDSGGGREGIGGTERERYVKGKCVGEFKEIKFKTVQVPTCLTDDGCGYTVTNLKVDLDTFDFTSGNPFISIGANFATGTVRGSSVTNTLAYGSSGKYQIKDWDVDNGSGFANFNLISTTNCESTYDVDDLEFMTYEDTPMNHISGTEEIFFGKPGCLKRADLKSPARCDVDTFGDPLETTEKSCYRRR